MMQILAVLFLVAGASLCLIAAVGVLRLPDFFMRMHSATKAGVIGLVKSMGKDYAETGITINSLAPAVIRTPMVAALPDAQVKYMTDKIPMKRCGELDEAAELISWIVSPACSFTTGFTFDLSGGRAVY
jgi:3-oxoacyl-[acyl-carrier protein] reductase